MSINNNLRSVIRLVDELRDCGIDAEIPLPRIAVIGTQSAGKSSLLESIVGYDFLPRGEGVVTRRPLELRLVHLPNEEDETYAVFEDEPNNKVEDLKIVKQMIEDKTNSMAGGKKNIIDTPIVLNIYSYACPNLSLVDLPGITRVPIANSDQTEDIEEITTDMTKKYINDERTIILCVIPANTDPSTSDALKLARKVDKEGKRTLGVLTKVDIIDKGANIIPILKNQVIELTHGYIAVKNRSQHDINSNMTVKDALAAEDDYFRGHSEYNALLDQVGTSILSGRLTELLHVHILNCLPSIEEQIRTKMDRSEDVLKKLGDPFPKEDGKKFAFLISKTKEIGNTLKDIMEGRTSLKLKEDNAFEGYAHFSLLMSKFNSAKQKLFVEGLKKIQPVEVILDIVNFRGISLPGFMPQNIIEKKVSEELDKLKIPIREFISDARRFNVEYLKAIFEMMHNVVGDARTFMHNIATAYLDKVTKETGDFIEKLVEIEKCMIWTSDVEYFMKEGRKNKNDDDENSPYERNGYRHSAQKVDKAVEFIKSEIPGFELELVKEAFQELSEGTYEARIGYKAKLKQLEESSMEILNVISEEEIVYFYEKLIKYYNVINKNITDTVTKIVGVNMVKNFSKGIEDHFMNHIVENMEALKKLKEDDSVGNKRKRHQELYDKLQKSVAILKDFNLTTELQ